MRVRVVAQLFYKYVYYSNVTRMLLVSYLNYVLVCVPVCASMYSLVCYWYVVLVTIVRKTMLMKLLVCISYWKSADLVACAN